MARALRDAAKAVKGTPDYEAAQKAYQHRLNDYAREAATRSLLRDLYSKNQLKEQLTWFWINHFNVSQNKSEIRALVGDYKESAIRPHVLGKFRDLLAATVFHPAMLQYLDNAQNAAAHINENYAREIMELHTMGVGSGYTQKDVQELARILTGVGVNLSGKQPNVRLELRGQYRAGNLFEFNPNRHDYGDKILLGVPIKGEGLREVAEAIAILTPSPRPRTTSANNSRNSSAVMRRRTRWSMRWSQHSTLATAISRRCFRRYSPRLSSRRRWAGNSRTPFTMRSPPCAPPMGTPLFSMRSHC